MAATDTTTRRDGLSSDEEQTLETALVLLRQCQHPQVRTLAEGVSALANPDAETQALEKMEGAVVALRKADPAMTRTQALEKARRENPDLAVELARAVHGVAA
jgi:hypothetical protein